MPYALEHWSKGKAIVVNTQTGKHYEKSPIPLARAERQLRLLRAVEHGFKPTGKPAEK